MSNCLWQLRGRPRGVEIDPSSVGEPILELLKHLKLLLSYHKITPSKNWLFYRFVSSVFSLSFLYQKVEA